jgi:hypothetical protein
MKVLPLCILLTSSVQAYSVLYAYIFKIYMILSFKLSKECRAISGTSGTGFDHGYYRMDGIQHQAKRTSMPPVII